MKNLADQELLTRTKRLVGCERRVNARVLECLVEIEQRTCHLARGYGSLFEYCVKDLGYSHAAAGRRVQAVRVARALPEVTQKIATGELTLASVSQVSSFLYQERKAGKPARTKIATRELLQTVAFSKDARETEQRLARVQGYAASPREQLRTLGPQTYRLSLNVNQELHQKLERIKTITSHKNGNPSYEEILERMATDYLERHDPKAKAKRAAERNKKKSTAKEAKISPEMKKRNDSIAMTHGSTDKVLQSGKKQCKSTSTKTVRTRYLPAKLRHAIYLRDQGRCTYVDTATTRRCSSTYRLEFHHKHPFAKGGIHTLGNLTLLCAQHNDYWAKQDFPRMQKPH